MTQLTIDGLEFSFADDWVVGKTDDWAFYRKQFSCMWNGIKSMDVMAVAPDKTAWFVEVKDYRQHVRTKPSDLGEEVAHKMFDTLAMLLPAKIRAIEATEHALATLACKAIRLRVVLHLEQPLKHSKLRPRAIDPANVQLKLRQLLKPIDPHPRVVEMNRMGGLEWKVA